MPTTTPNSMMSANGRTTSPPSAAIAIRLPSAVLPVSTVRGNVSLTERLSTLANPSCLALCRFSRTRSKITIVSLSE